MKQLQ